MPGDDRAQQRVVLAEQVTQLRRAQALRESRVALDVGREADPDEQLLRSIGVQLDRRLPADVTVPCQHAQEKSQRHLHEDRHSEGDDQ